tara:strand:- start:684 stop:1199 length:516 start_codon:yes stop_codon:yes gene_type:complete
MLRTEELILRAMEPSDLELLYSWENDTKNWSVSNTLSPFSKVTLANFINSPQDIYASKQQRLMIDLVTVGETIGCIDFFDFDPKHKRAGVGILIAVEQERGKGYAKIALNELVDYSREVLDLNQLYCNILADNQKSIHLFESVGFTKVGTKKDWCMINGAWVDELMFQLFL